MSEKQSLQFYLGAEDIDRIVKVLLPILESYLPNRTKDQQYVLLTTLVNSFSNNTGIGSRWQMQLGVRYIFN